MRDRDFARVAETVPFLERDRCALVPGGKLVRPGADRMIGFVGCALLVDDDRRVLAEVEQSVKARILEFEHGDVGIARVDRLDRGEERLFLVRGVLGRVALERELDVLGGKRLAVLEFDALLQIEGQRLQIGRKTPFVRQQRGDGKVLVDLGEAFEDIIVHDLADRRRRARCRIETRRRLQRHADRDAVLGRGEGRKSRERGGDGDGDTESAHATSPTWLETNSMQLCTAGGATVKLVRRVIQNEVL